MQVKVYVTRRAAHGPLMDLTLDGADLRFFEFEYHIEDVRAVDLTGYVLSDLHISGELCILYLNEKVLP